MDPDLEPDLVLVTEAGEEAQARDLLDVLYRGAVLPGVLLGAQAVGDGGGLRVDEGQGVHVNRGTVLHVPHPHDATTDDQELVGR